MQKPILAFVTEGAQKDLLEESKLAHFVDVDNTTKGVEQLKMVFTESIKFKPNREFINSFQIDKLTKKLAKTLDLAINN